MLTTSQRISWSLLALRLSVFIVMFVWTLDKFINPEHASKVFSNFYKIPDIEYGLLYLLGGLQAVLILAFVAGFKKRLSYGAVLVMHSISTMSAWKAYIDMQMLFFAAWPVLAACISLYLLRDLDTKFALEK